MTIPAHDLYRAGLVQARTIMVNVVVVDEFQSASIIKVVIVYEDIILIDTYLLKEGLRYTC
jgi:hypothetical protein